MYRLSPNEQWIANQDGTSPSKLTDAVKVRYGDAWCVRLILGTSRPSRLAAEAPTYDPHALAPSLHPNQLGVTDKSMANRRTA